MGNKFKPNMFLKILLTVTALGFQSGSWASQDFNKIIIFGDSLSDGGNVYAALGQTSKAPYEVIPSAPYTIGGHQFSNGKTWAQRFARNLSLNNSGKAALDSPGKNGNYAFGGARARGAGTSPSSAAQVFLYLSDNGLVAESDALYVIQFGGNDIRDALEDLQANPLNPVPAMLLVAQAVAAVEDAIEVLYGAGARHFLVVSAPDLGLSPALRFQPPPPPGFPSASDLGTAFSFYFNEGVSPVPPIPSFTLGLNSVLDNLEALPGITIHRLDIFLVLNQIFNFPGQFGISEVNFPCLTFGVKSGAKCSNPEEHLFWDGIHPTAVIHKQVADIATEMF